MVIDELKREYENYRFQRLEQTTDGICISWDKETGKLCRIRSISQSQKEVYCSLQAIDNSHMPDILHIGFDFVAEEFISGSSLKERLKKGNLTPREVKNILKQLLPAIQQLHQNGIIHRDIKASNIMSDNYENYYLVDFDIAIKDGAADETAGTAGYASPEQYGYKDCDARSDIYSIGVLANKLLTGQMPKEGLAKGRIGRIIKKCVMIDPQDRYQTAEELYHAIFLRKKHIAKYFFTSTVCAAVIFFSVAWWLNSRNTKNGNAGEINSVAVQWMELESYNISYPCLQGMEQIEADDVNGTDIQKIEKNMPAWRDEQEDIFEKQYYFKTADNVWFSMSAVRNAGDETGYDILMEGLESRKENLAYADAENTSFCYGKTYNDDNVLYYAGTSKNGLWLYMAMLCPKAFELEYKEYLETWRSSIKEAGTVYSWQDKWAKYKGGKYTDVQYFDDVTVQNCLEILSVDNEKIIFSITRTKQENDEKSYSTTGYIKGYIIDDKVVFAGDWSGEWSGESVQGILQRGDDEEHILLKYDDLYAAYLSFIDSY